MADMHRFTPSIQVSAQKAAEKPHGAVLPPHQRLRKLWLKLHLYTGLFVGGVFVLVSLTGSALVFYKAIDAWLNPHELTVRGEGPYRPLDDILAAAHSAAPTVGALDSLVLPLNDAGVFVAWIKIPTESAQTFRWRQITVDPYTARVLSDREWGNYLVSFIYELHESFLLDDPGETLVGCVALLLVLSIGSGLYLWWPTSGRLRRAFTLSRGASTIRWHYDLHKLTGAGSAVILFILALTGVYLEFPKYVIPVVNIFSAVSSAGSDKDLHSLGAEEAQPISIDRAVSIARNVFPDAQLRFIGVPQNERGVYQVTLRRPGEVGEFVGQSRVWLDQYSGRVLKVRDWEQLTAGDTFIAWLFPLHNGEALGMPGRLIVFCTGFVPVILYVTALRMWWLKRKAHQRQKDQASASLPWTSVKASQS